MITESVLAVKSLMDCEPGELVHVVSHRRICLALVVSGVLEDRFVRIALISGYNDEGELVHFKSNASNIAQSYGTDWFLAPQRGSISSPGNNKALYDNGRLVLARDGFWLRFSAFNGTEDDIVFNLSKSTMSDRFGEDPIPFKGFAIWESRETYHRKSDPLFELVIEDRT